MTENQIDRRKFLAGTAAVGAGVYFAGDLAGTFNGGPVANAAMTPNVAGYGPLVADPKKILDLPAGFTYKVVAHAGETKLDSGEFSASDPDGTGFVSVGSGLLGSVDAPSGGFLIMNHEVGGSEPFGVPPQAGITYDPNAGGGCTVVGVNAAGERTGEYVGVAGTVNNCAGGMTPWGTWITCEETELKVGGTAFAGKKATKNHGYCFEVSANKNVNERDAAVPLKFLGRYAHEAICIDPGTQYMYLTEDAGSPNGLWYRWTPPAGFKGGPGAYAALARSEGGATAGTLEALRAIDSGQFAPDLSVYNSVGKTLKTEWVKVEDRDAATTSVRKQAFANGATRSRKFEGTWWDAGKGGCHVVASFARLKDGSKGEHDGQVWFFDPKAQTMTLTVVFGVNANPDADTNNYDGPDNITVNPYGGVVVTEDGEGVQHVVGIDAKGGAFPIARNAVSDSEFAGCVFSADKKTLYVSIQGDGYTLSIQGPWEKIAGGTTGGLGSGSLDAGSLNTGSLGTGSLGN